MTPVAVAAVFIAVVMCAVIAYVLLMRQARRYEVQMEALRNSVWREAAGRQDAEALIRELLGEDPESTALDKWELHEFDAMADFLRADMGIPGSDEGAAP